MNRLIAPGRAWWEGRTRRERGMLAVMIALVAAVCVWLGVVRPVGEWRLEAARERMQAETDLADVRRALAAMPSAATVAGPATDAQGLEPVVRQTAEAAGLEITTGMDPAGRLGFRIARGSSAAVFGWLAALKTTHRIEAVSLGVIENADATLQVEGAFQP